MVTQNAKKFSLLSNLSQNLGWILGMSLLLCFFLAFSAPAQAANLPSPTLLAPSADIRLGQDRVWVGGVAFNDLEVTVLVDDEEKANINVRNHASGVGSFGVELVNLSLGAHQITSISRDNNGRTSVISNVLTINVEPKTPAPTIYKPVVNSDFGIERPFIVGNIQSGLDVKIVINNKIVASISPEVSETGVSSFAWQSDTDLALGQHKIEVFASDKGKLSNNSAPVYWQVGKIEDKISQNEVEAPAGGDDAGITIIESKDGEQALTVTDTKKAEEKPIIPEPAVDNLGKVDTGEIKNNEIAVNDQGDKVQETAPGAVVKQVVQEEGAGFELNNSLIVGIAILVFLLLSMAVWYVQERKDKLGDKVVDMFKDKDSSKNDDLPPPPPPVF